MKGKLKELMVNNYINISKMINPQIIKQKKGSQHITE